MAQLGLSAGLNGIVDSQFLLFPNLCLAHRHTEPWQPHPIPSLPDRQALRIGLEAITRWLRDRRGDKAVPGPLGEVLVRDPSLRGMGLSRPRAFGSNTSATTAALGQAAETAMSDLTRWLQALEHPVSGARPHGLPASLAALVGLGPGLTPTGDDVLAGVSLGLRHFGRPDAANRLGSLLDNVIGENTNRISIAHLRAAGCGHAPEPVRDLIAHWLGITTQHTVEELRRAVSAVLDIGHSSGADILYGVRGAAFAILAAGGAREPVQRN